MVRNQVQYGSISEFRIHNSLKQKQQQQYRIQIFTFKMKNQCFLHYLGERTVQHCQGSKVQSWKLAPYTAEKTILSSCFPFAFVTEQEKKVYAYTYVQGSFSMVEVLDL